MKGRLPLALWMAAQPVAVWLLPAAAGWAQPFPTLAAALLAAVQVGLTLGVGLAFLRLLRRPLSSGIAEGGVALALGAGALGVLILLLGLAGLCSVTPLRLLASALSLATAPLTWSWLREMAGHLRIRAVEAPLWLVGTLPAALLLLHAAVPSLAYDVLEYHLAVPRAWMRSGSIAPIPGNFFSHQPFAAEVNFLLGLAMGADRILIVPKFLNLGALAAALMLVFALARDQGLGRAASGAATLCALGTPLIFKICSDALVDIWVVLGVLAAVHLLHAWLRTRHLGALVAFGLALGFLISLKHTATVFWVTPLGLVFLWTLLSHRFSPAEVVPGIVFVTLFASAFAAPWLIKELAWTGNPVFPLAHGLFGGEGWGDAQAHLLVAGHGLRSPFEPALWADAWGRLGVLGPFPVSLLIGSAVFAWRRRVRGVVAPTLVIVVMAWLLWNLLAGGADRFVAPAAMIMASLGVGGLWSAAAWGRRHGSRLPLLVIGMPFLEAILRVGQVDLALQILLVTATLAMALILLARRTSLAALAGVVALCPVAAVVLLIALSDFSSSPTPGERFAHLAGGMSRSELTAGFPHLAAHRHLNLIERPPGRTLFIYEARTFNFDLPAVYGTAFDGQPLREYIRGARGVEEVLVRLRDDGITHILINFHEGERLRRFYQVDWNFPEPLPVEELDLIQAMLEWTARSAVLDFGGVIYARVP